MRRRDFLGAASVVALSSQVAVAQPVPLSSGSESPALHAPPGTTDCHHYIYNPRYPVVSRYISHPKEADPDDYRGLMRRLGITRHVVIQPSTYGTDNRAMLDALKTFGAEARGVAVVAASVSDTELKRLNELGVRGLRVNFAPAGPMTPAMIEPLARRIEPLGWHIEINAWARDLAAMAPFLERLPTPVTLDHFAHIPEPEGASDTLFAQVLRLVDKGKTWVKLAAPYDASKVGPPGYADSSALARAYVKAAPERLIWGTNWPHPGENLRPDDAQIFDLLSDWAPDAATRNRILVGNPAILYGFPAIA
ncbi:MAG TPA: amidohydrolase family protein [Stellaceae bacterium]|nr:amidohydrolase family protein [Stellaceae bacterium]